MNGADPDFEEGMDNLSFLIDYVSGIHRRVSMMWLDMIDGGSIDACNIRKRTVLDMRSDRSIDEFVSSYDRFLNDIKVRELFMYEGVPDFSVCNRIKMQNSVSMKADVYLLKDHGGRVSIDKCFNDLFGIRVITDAPLTLESICTEARRHPYDIRCIDSTKHDPSGRCIYRATHLYFRGSDNRVFPWELQVWRKEHEESNYMSHKECKQAYTSWERVI